MAIARTPSERNESRNGRQTREVERRRFFATIVDTPGNLTAQTPRHEGLRLLIHQVEEIRPVAAGDLEHVAKAFSRDEPRLHAFAFGERIDDDGRAVSEKGDGRNVDLALGENIEHALIEIRRGGVDLGRADRLPS